MAKRRAETQLFAKDLDKEDEPEAPGVFPRAPEEVLATRTIKKAKRTISTTADNDSAAPSPFASFSFYGNGKTAPDRAATTMTSATVSPSNGDRTSDEYLSKVAKLNRDILECITRLMDNGAYLNLTPCFEDYMKHFQRLTREEEDRQRKNNNNNSNSNNNNNNSNNGTASPSVVLPMSAGNSIPEADSGVAKQSAEPPKQTFSFGSSVANKTSTFGGTSSSSLFKFDSAPKATTPESNSKPEFQFAKRVEPAKKFTFGLSTASTASTPEAAPGSTATSLFGIPVPTGAQSQGFSFGLLSSSSSSTSVSASASSFQSGFGVNTSQTSAAGAGGSQTANDDDCEEDQPPKVDIAPVEEEGSLYTKKVKLYYKKKQPDEKGAFAEKGIGFLHIKPLDNGGHQLLVRAQTTLGNVLLNIRLGKDMPVSRMKNNNVAIICVPNPPLDPQSPEKSPTMFLIKVKSKEDAAELHEKLVEFKGAA